MSWPQWGVTAAVGWEGAGINLPPMFPGLGFLPVFLNFSLFSPASLVLAPPGWHHVCPKVGAPQPHGTLGSVLCPLPSLSGCPRAVPLTQLCPSPVNI